MKKVQNFIDAALMICTEKTLYVMGGWGQKLTPSNKVNLINAQKYNKASTRKKMIEESDDDTRAFDCSGLIKSILWGYCGDDTITGGARYGSRNVPDHNAAQLIGDCYGVSDNFEIIKPGEIVYMQGHVGIYVGDGYVVECTPKWKNCVQRTRLEDRKWLKHGFLPYIEYNKEAVVHVVPSPTLRRGCRSMKVSQLQDCLVTLGYDIAIDGSYGPETQKAVKRFQDSEHIQIDGIYGPQTRNKLLEVM